MALRGQLNLPQKPAPEGKVTALPVSLFLSSVPLGGPRSLALLAVLFCVTPWGILVFVRA